MPWGLSLGCSLSRRAIISCGRNVDGEKTPESYTDVNMNSTSRYMFDPGILVFSFFPRTPPALCKTSCRCSHQCTRCKADLYVVVPSDSQESILIALRWGDPTIALAPSTSFRVVCGVILTCCNLLLNKLEPKCSMNSSSEEP